MQENFIGFCEVCKKEIYKANHYLSDRRFPGIFCSVTCSNQATEDKGYSNRDYQTWK